MAPEDAERMVVSRLSLSGEVHAADLESSAVGAYPVTSELTSMSDCAVPQAWAAAFDRAGFDGVHDRGRFSCFDASSWAVFGAAGPDSHRAVDESPLDGHSACAHAGITVLPALPTDLVGLTIVPPPDPAAP